MFLRLLAAEEGAGLLRHLARKGEQADEVGQHHQAVEGVGQGPGGGEIRRGPGQDQGQKSQPVGPHRPRAKEVAPAFGAVLAPAQHRRPGKQQHRPRHKPGPQAPQRGGKGFARQPGRRGRGEHPAGVQVHQAGGEHGQGGHGADQEGGDEHLEDAPHPLAGGLAGGGRAAGDGRGPQPRLAGKAAPHEPPLHRRRGAVAHDAAPGGPQPQGAPEDGFQSRRQGRRVGQDDQGRPGQVEHRHKGDQPAGGRGDPFHPPQQDQPGEEGQPRPRQEGRQAEGPFQAGGNGVHLAQVADAERGQHAQHSKAARQRPPGPAAMGQGPHPRRKIVHGPAVPGAGPKPPVPQAQQVLGVGGHHPEKGHHPHPENGARTPADQGRAHPHDAAGADGGPQGGAQALQGADAPRILPGQVGAAAQDGPQGLPQPQGQAPQLEPAGPHRHPQPRRSQQPHPQRPPYRPVDRSQQLHHAPHLPDTQKQEPHHGGMAPVMGMRGQGGLCLFGLMQAALGGVPGQQARPVQGGADGQVQQHRAGGGDQAVHQGDPAGHAGQGLGHRVVLPENVNVAEIAQQRVGDDVDQQARPRRHRHPQHIRQAAGRVCGVDPAQPVGRQPADHADDELEHEGGDGVARVAGQDVGQGQPDGAGQPSRDAVHQQGGQGGEGVAQMERRPAVKGHPEKQVGRKAQGRHDAGQRQLMGGEGALVQHTGEQDNNDHDGQQQPHGSG